MDVDLSLLPGISPRYVPPTKEFSTEPHGTEKSFDDLLDDLLPNVQASISDDAGEHSP